ncbi:MAG: hypothetical protein LAT78_14040, partial [Roseinatronobacter sp.]|nr:hypothetical protein [Roseinatronobacter sp.]
MRLQALAHAQTGIALFDTPITASVLWQPAQGGAILLTSSGRNGGLASWSLGPQGQLQAIGQTAYAHFSARDGLVLAPLLGEMVAFFGATATHFRGIAINPDGTLGPVRAVSFAHVERETLAGDTSFLPLWALQREVAAPGFEADLGWRATTAFAAAPDGGYLLSSALDSAITWLAAGTAPEKLGADLGISAPTGLVVLGDRVVVAGAAGSSLSVLRADGGTYLATDHVIDTNSTAFRRVQAISGLQAQTGAGAVDLVFVGGNDHGISAFAVTREGWLVWLDTFFDTPQTGIFDISTLQAVQQGSDIVITATSHRDTGVTVLRLPLANFGGIVQNGQGTAQDNILIAQPGVTQLSAGGGANIFVIRPQDAAITITGFAPGLDRLDLSAWPMLRDISQFQFQTRPGGAWIGYRGYELHITSRSGAALALQDIFPQGLLGPDRVMILTEQELLGALTAPEPQPEPEPEPQPQPEPEPQPD